MWLDVFLPFRRFGQQSNPESEQFMHQQCRSWYCESEIKKKNVFLLKMKQECELKASVGNIKSLKNILKNITNNGKNISINF